VNAGSLSDLANLANESLYGFEDYHGIDIGVVRAVRLWYAPVAGEFSIEIKLKEEDSKLGFAISRTEEVSILIMNIHILMFRCCLYHSLIRVTVSSHYFAESYRANFKTLFLKLLR